MDLDENDLYGSGLNRTDWYMLRDAILCASWTSDNQSKDFERLPKHLQEHAIGQIVANSPVSYTHLTLPTICSV